MNFLKKYPIPIAGLILSLFALGNLLQSYSAVLRLCIGGMAALLYGCFLAKLCIFNVKLREPLQNPVIASVFPTITMASMLFAVYLKPFVPAVAPILWYCAIIAHLVLMIWFSMKFLRNFTIKAVFPSWYIVYVGIAVASVTAPAINIRIGQAAFWLAFTGYFCTMPFVCYRVWKVKDIPEPAKPTLVILSAPASLLLAGYLNSFTEKNMVILSLLVCCSFLFYAIALYYIVILRKISFTPAFSAFTFPLVISALAAQLLNKFLQQHYSTLTVVVKIEEAVAAFIVLWVFIGYMRFLFGSEKKPV